MSATDALTVWIVNDGVRDHFYITRTDIPVHAVAAHFLAIDGIHDGIGRIDPIGEDDWYLIPKSEMHAPRGFRQEKIHIEREPLMMNHWY